jgi:16S rRNA (cytosine1402-N4)-methyltransferase
MTGHRSVLLHEAIEFLAIEKDDVVVDATLGGAGHARAIADRLDSGGVLVGFDLDHDAIERAKVALPNSRCTLHFAESNFRRLNEELVKFGIEKIDKALFDLGWSSFQLDAGRGFSFQKDEPLLMTYSKDPSALTAKTIVNEWSEESLADIIFGWGEERYSRRIAKRIVDQRETKPFETSKELGDAIKAAVPSAYRFGRIHPATKTFQALRIAVNDELGALKEGIRAAWDRLDPGGRIAVITFHSIEDREVKRLFADLIKSGGHLIVKKPITASAEELQENPRARSAKLRVIEKDQKVAS